MDQAIIKNACFQDRNNFDIIQGRKFDSIVKFNHDVLSQYSNFTFLFADYFFFFHENVVNSKTRIYATSIFGIEFLFVI